MFFPSFTVPWYLRGQALELNCKGSSPDIAKRSLSDYAQVTWTSRHGILVSKMKTIIVISVQLFNDNMR